jgi:hypothetical protein
LYDNGSEMGFYSWYILYIYSFFDMVQVDALTIVIGLFFLGLLYVLIQGGKNKETLEVGDAIRKDIGFSGTTHDSGRTAASEVVYTQDYYPWWRSTRWWNYDGWLYQRPYFNYWRRPYYYNYFTSSRPKIIGGKAYYNREHW